MDWPIRPRIKPLAIPPDEFFTSWIVCYEDVVATGPSLEIAYGRWHEKYAHRNTNR